MKTALQRLYRRGWRLWCLCAAAASVAFIFAGPTLRIQRDVYRYVFVIDITQSMNARDYHIEGMPADRLSFVKAAVRRSLRELPCRSEVGLGVFSTQNMLLLFQPLEICRHYAVIEESLAHIDWRMAWAGDSHIARGLYTSIRDLAAMESAPHLVFFSDGQTTPSDAFEPPFLEKRGAVRGWIVGVGGLKPVPVPRLDKEGADLGFWTVSEAEHTEVPRYDPEGRGSGKSPENQGEIYLSALQETELKRLAGITGLRYHRLRSPDKLTEALMSNDLARQQAVTTDVRWIFALTTLILIIAPYIPNFLSPKRKRHVHG